MHALVVRTSVRIFSRYVCVLFIFYILQTVAPQEAKSTAWQEWKGQVIQQGFAAERAVAPQRSASEIIAEGYDARI